MRPVIPPFRVLLAALVAASLPVAAQVIEVRGNGMVITDGDTTPSSADHTHFGDIPVGAGFVGERVFTIENTGTAPLQIINVRTTGFYSAQFTIPLQPEAVVLPGSSTQFVVWFIPSGPGNRNATVQINSTNLGDIRHEFTVAGTGVTAAPEINLRGNGLTIIDGDPSPSAADGTDFGPADVDGGTVARTFTIENTGSANLTLDNIQKIGGNASEFLITAAASTPVFAGYATTFEVTFNPSAAGTRTTTIRVNNNDADESTYDFVVRGEGVETVPDIALTGNGVPIANGDTSPESADHTYFGSLPVPAAPATRTFTIHNAGNEDLIVSSVTTAGGDAADFIVPTTLPGPIGGGASADLEVVFTPTAPGLRSTTLRIASNDPEDGTYEVTLQGALGGLAITGIEPSGTDALVQFDSNPDPSFFQFLYTLEFRADLNAGSWNPVANLTTSGGGPRQLTHVDGWTGTGGHWRIREVGIPAP